MSDLVHELKTWPEFFQATLDGGKRFEVRENDRDFRVGDFALLREYEPQSKSYTGRMLMARISYVTGFAQVNGWVVLGIAVMSCEEF